MPSYHGVYSVIKQALEIQSIEEAKKYERRVDDTE